MGFRVPGIVALGMLVVLGEIASAGAGDQTPTPTPGPASPADQIQAAIARATEASRPGVEQKRLAPLVGSWNLEASWLSPPHPATHLKGTAENRWILDGRFVLSEASLGEGESRIDSMTIWGFDQRQKRYFAVALNSLRSSPLLPTGSYDPSAQSLILSGKERDEATGIPLVYREVLKIDGPDHHILRLFFDVPGRPPLKVMEAAFTRR